MWPDWVIYFALGNFSKPAGTIILPKLPTLFGNFCKGVKIFHFHFWATFIDIWRLFTGHTAIIPRIGQGGIILLVPLLYNLCDGLLTVLGLVGGVSTDHHLLLASSWILNLEFHLTLWTRNQWHHRFKCKSVTEPTQLDWVECLLNVNNILTTFKRFSNTKGAINIIKYFNLKVCGEPSVGTCDISGLGLS